MFFSEGEEEEEEEEESGAENAVDDEEDGEEENVESRYDHRLYLISFCLLASAANMPGDTTMALLFSCNESDKVDCRPQLLE